MTVTHKEFPGWQLLEVVDTGYFIATCNKRIPHPDFLGASSLEKYVVRIEGFYPTYVMSQSMEEFFKKEFWEVYTRFQYTCPISKEIKEGRQNNYPESDNKAYFEKNGTPTRELQAVEFVRYHLTKTAFKFAAHNYLKVVLGLDIHKVHKLTISKNRLYVSYLLGEAGRKGKGCTILSQKKVADLVDYSALDWMPMRDPWWHTNTENRESNSHRNRCTGFVITVPNPNSWEEPIQHFVCGRSKDEMGYTRTDTVPEFSEYALLELDFNRMLHKYSSSFCPYEAYFAYNGGSEESYEICVYPGKVSSGYGFQPKAKANKKKK